MIRITITILGLMLLGACEFKSQDQLRAGQMVRFFEKDSGNFCNGNVRNPIVLNYFQIDNIECHYTNPSVTGIRLHPSMILSAKELKEVWWQSDCSGGKCYTPVIGNGQIPNINACHRQIDSTYYRDLCNFRIFFKDLDGKWRDNLTGDRYEEEPKIIKTNLIEI